VSTEAVRAGLSALTGEIRQVPSAVSAIKVDGVRSYARVRSGQEVALAARPVTVFRLALLDLRRHAAVVDVDVDVECSSGTYVRALARDLGATLGVGGHVTALRRTAVGVFTLEEASTLDELAARDDPVTLPLPAAAARFFRRRDATAEESRVLSHGGPLSTVGIAEPYAVFDPGGELLGIVRERDGMARAEVVLVEGGSPS
jgi:tRNA pseudouridine55 synthase